MNVPIQQLRAQVTNPLNAAELDLTLAYTLNSLFWIYLRTQGVAPKDHAVSAELDRIKNYMVRLKQAKETKGAPGGQGQGSDPQVTLNQDAANRFISAALAGNKALDAAKAGLATSAAASILAASTKHAKKVRFCQVVLRYCSTA